MKKTIVLLYCIFLSFLSYSQESSKGNGYIITYKNDTIKGNFKNKKMLNTQISFKSINSNEFIVYSPKGIKEFCIKNKGVYKSKRILKKDVFLLCLIEGTATLYKYENHYFIEKNAEFFKLEFEHTIIKNNSPHEDTRYMKVLEYAFSDCSDINIRIAETKYTSESLVKLIKYYNNRVNKNITSSIYPDSFKTKFRWGIKAGSVFNKVIYTNPMAAFYSYKFEHKTGYTVGIFFNISNRKKFSFQPELLITKKHTIGKRDFGGIQKQLNLSFTYLQLPLTAQYSISKGKLNPYISVGVVGGLALEKNNYTIESSGYINEIEINNFEFGFKTGFGVLFPILNNKLISIEYHFEKTFTGFNYVLDHFNHNTHSVTLNYSF